jgi:hypothetical protein
MCWSLHSDTVDLLAAAKARVHHARENLEKEERKALVNGNYSGATMTLDKLKDELIVAEGYLAHLLAKTKQEGTE